MIQDDQVWYHMMRCYVSCLQASLSFSFCLKAYSISLFFVWPRCTNQDSNCVYAGTNLWHKIWYQYMHHNGMVCMLWEVWSLMCTSNVAGNTQMASLDRQVTQNGLEVINAMARNIQWRDTTIPRWYGGYRPCRWWVAVMLMEIPRWWRLIPK